MLHAAPPAANDLRIGTGRRLLHLGWHGLQSAGAASSIPLPACLPDMLTLLRISSPSMAQPLR